MLCRPRWAVAGLAAAEEELLASAGLVQRMAELLEVRRGDLEARRASGAVELARGWWTALEKKVEFGEAKRSTGHKMHKKEARKQERHVTKLKRVSLT